MPRDERPVLVLGATGYVGGRLVPRLFARGHRVRAASRSRAKVAARPWADDARVEPVEADALDEASLRRAMAGCRAVYYLVHSMGAGHADFAERDRLAARNVARAAATEGLDRVIYLGGLGEESPELSEHLRSRHEVGDILREGEVPTTVLRAAVILGSGSGSFEILRYLVDRLPVMVAPRWVDTPCQPIAIRNVLGYLLGCLENEATTGGTFDIGGPDVVTYRRLMEMYAEEAGLRRRIILGVPVLSPRLSSYWIHLVTPAPARLAQPLALGLRNPVLVQDERIRGLVPQDLLSCREAIRLAIGLTRAGDVETSWLDAGAMPPALRHAPTRSAWRQPGDPEWTGGTVLEDEREAHVDAPPERVWEEVTRIGGERGYHYADWLWGARGALDKLTGGVGLRRGRRHPQELRAGDALDFWRVRVAEPPRRLLLGAEMRLPGRATLEFEVEPEGDGARLVQRARFRPRGLWGLAYWYGVHPLHALVFRGMLRGLARASAQDAHSMVRRRASR